MTLEPSLPAGLRLQQKIFTILGIAIAASLVFWPLLTSVASLALAAYWLFGATKKYPQDSDRRLFMVLFTSLYILALIGTLYSANKDEAFFKLQQKSALLRKQIP